MREVETRDKIKRGLAQTVNESRANARLADLKEFAADFTDDRLWIGLAVQLEIATQLKRIADSLEASQDARGNFYVAHEV